ncbi:MAG: PocR ligand-binding domain-containing protein [Anaerolineae bacterium]
MSEFLTTRQVQELFQVDRTTIYRMLKDGRLAGIKIGNRWRFPKSKMDELLSDASAEAEPTPLSLDVLPLTCLQGMQNVSAEAIGICAITTDTAGVPLTQMSHPTRFCRLIQSSETGRAACQADLSRIARRAGAPRPQVTCHAGLQCAGEPIAINGTVTAVFIACQYTTTPLNSEGPHHIRQVAEAYDLDPADLVEAAAEIPVLDPAQRQKVADWLPKLTRTLSEIGQERAELLDRLQRIASMSAIG